MSVIGVDPGLSGALAHYASGTIVDIVDMPVFDMVINKKTRSRLDMVGLHEYFLIKKLMGIRLVIIESVGGRPQQSASAAFVFGYTVGAIFTMCIALKIPVHPVPAPLWKKALQVPGKKDNKTKRLDKAYGTKIITRADELLPDYRHMWRGPQGGLKVDRAESALLAMYGEQYALRVPQLSKPYGPAEYEMIYKHAQENL